MNPRCNKCDADLKYRDLYFFSDSLYCRRCCPWVSYNNNLNDIYENVQSNFDNSVKKATLFLERIVCNESASKSINMTQNIATNSIIQPITF